ncbi:hypothetical protein B0O99DRAFT_267242 [Bisporella sp. PMI_857]|nr:hypothetical protein B0O99DRAFT_267242 [Bisporella sp. PMI_857]
MPAPKLPNPQSLFTFPSYAYLPPITSSAISAANSNRKTITKIVIFRVPTSETDFSGLVEPDVWRNKSWEAEAVPGPLVVMPRITVAMTGFLVSFGAGGMGKPATYREWRTGRPRPSLTHSHQDRQHGCIMRIAQARPEGISR